MAIAETRTGGGTNARQASSGVIWAIIFIVTLFIPLQYRLGTLLLTPQRLFLLLLFFPMVFKWLSGKTGRILAVDIIVLGYVLWFAIALLVDRGTKAIELVGITTIETFGAYLVARCFVQSVDDVIRVSKALFVLLLLMIPAAVLESLYAMRIYNDLFGMLGRTFPWVNYQPRMGLFRAQVVFEHPILFGVFTSMAFSILYLTPRPGTEKVYGWRRAWAVGAAGFFSLSSGAYLSIVTQVILLVWDRLTKTVKSRWMIFLGLVVGGYIIIDLLSNRTPFQVFASYMTFNSGTAYWRILIFRYGMDNVWANPLFGLGLRQWIRPAWMYTASVDNFWLLTAMRSGIPSFLLIAAAFITLIVQLSLLQISEFRRNKARYSAIFSLIGLSMGLATVHVWGSSYMFTMFLLGFGAWLIAFPDPNLKPNVQDAPESAEPQTLVMGTRLSRYTRFADKRGSGADSNAPDVDSEKAKSGSGRPNRYRR